MSTQSQDIRWLNGFLQSLWPAASELIGAEFSHAAVTAFNRVEIDSVPPAPPAPGPTPRRDPARPPDAESGPSPRVADLVSAKKAIRRYRRTMNLRFRAVTDELGRTLKVTLRMSRSSTRIHLRPPPQFRATGPESITAYFPPLDADRHHLRTRISTLGKVGEAVGLRIRVDAYLRLRVRLSADEAPVVSIDKPVLATDRRGAIAQSLHQWKDEVKAKVTDNALHEKLGFLSTARYDPVAARTTRPRRIFPDRGVLPDGINLVLVPDGFNPEDHNLFDAYVQAVRDRLYQPDDERVNEPFHSFRSVLHLWELRPDQRRDGDFVVGAHAVGSGYAACLGNLARLAAIGRSAEEATSGTTILVFIAHRRAAQFDQARAAGRKVRAMAMGNVVLLPLRENHDVRAFANLLLHELGHTVLGNLADEYDENKHETYRGQQRLAPNLESEPVRRPGPGAHSLRFTKWEEWIRNPEHLPVWNQHPIIGVEGGGYYGRGIWRPAQDCAMNSGQNADMAQFCAVCREQVTRTMCGLLPPGRFLLRISDATRDAELLMVEPVTPDRTLIREQLRVTVGATAEIQVGLLAGTLPEPWTISTHLKGAGRLQSPRDHRFIEGAVAPPRAWSFRGQVGDLLTMKINSGCPFTPSDETPQYTIELECR
ncbi:M64 family metallopeptidase [Nesterenkonia natronophila]|nr:M64 family metallopeptidase [Nesterenkonia natronophila]